MMIAVFSLTAKAQTEKGTWLLGGSVAFNTSGGSSVFMVNPNIGYFLTDNLAAGANLSVATTSGLTTWAIGPFVRGYFTKSTSGKPFLGASFLVGGTSVSGNSSTSTGFGVEGGYALFLNRSVALNLMAQYTKVGKGTDGTFGIGAGFQIHFRGK